MSNVLALLAAIGIGCIGIALFAFMLYILLIGRLFIDGLCLKKEGDADSMSRPMKNPVKKFMDRIAKPKKHKDRKKQQKLLPRKDKYKEDIV